MTKYSFINLSLNQIFFEFWMCKTFNLVQTHKSDVIELINTYSASSKSHLAKHIKLVVIDQYKSVHINAKDVIVFAAMHMKIYYNKTHQSHFFNIDDTVNLQLHCEYTLFSFIDQNKKLKQQFVDSLCIVEQINKLVYHLDIFTSWWIHDVVLIVHLKLVYMNNSYWCFWSDHSNIIVILSDTELKWKFEWLLWKCIYWKEHDYITEYLAHWLKYKSEFDTWINIKNLENAKDLIDDFKQKNRADKKAALS